MRLTSRIVLTCAFSVLVAPVGAQAPAGTRPVGAHIDRASFTFQRRIPEGTPGVVWMRLDLAALSHSRLADVRLVSADGFQVPYLLEDDPAPLRVTLPTLAVVADEDVARSVSQRRGRHRTVYALVWPLVPMPPCRLMLETRARVFEREVTLLARTDNPRSREPRRWQAQAWGAWRHADPDRAAAPLVLDLPSVDSTDARLVVDEGDNQPLPLEQPVLELRTWRLRFVRETAHELWLVYGRRDLEAPRYDLALLDARLRADAANEVSADPEPVPQQSGAGERSTLLFWGALVGSIVVLLAVLARLLRMPPDQP
jgi:hypothetical protein